MTLFQPLWPTRPSPEALRRGSEAAQKARALQPPTERSGSSWPRRRRSFWIPPHPTTGSASAGGQRPRKPSLSRSRTMTTPPPSTRSRFWPPPPRTPFPGITPTGPPRSCFACTSATRTTRAPCTISFTPTTWRAGSGNRSRSRASTSWSRRTIRTRSTCRPTSTRVSETGTRSSAETCGRRRRRSSIPRGTTANSSGTSSPHTIEYLIYAYLQEGADGEAAAQLKRLRATARLEPSFKTAFHLASTQARYALERGEWSEAARIVPREPAGVVMGPLRLARSDRVVRPRPRSGAPRQSRRGQGRRRASRRARGRRPQGGGGPVHTEHPGAPPGARCPARPRSRAGRIECRAPAGGGRARDLDAQARGDAGPHSPRLRASRGTSSWSSNSRRKRSPPDKRSMELYPKRFNSLLGAARGGPRLRRRRAGPSVLPAASRRRRRRNPPARPHGSPNPRRPAPLTTAQRLSPHAVWSEPDGVNTRYSCLTLSPPISSYLLPEKR